MTEHELRREIEEAERELWKREMLFRGIEAAEREAAEGEGQFDDLACYSLGFAKRDAGQDYRWQEDRLSHLRWAIRLYPLIGVGHLATLLELDGTTGKVEYDGLILPVGEYPVWKLMPRVREAQPGEWLAEALAASS